MTDRILLTDKEQTAAVVALRAPFNGIHFSDDDYGLLEGVIDAINRIRAGDPVGTIRRGSNGNISVRVRVFNEYEPPVERWVHVSTSSGMMARSDNDYVCDWPVIFTPDGAA